MTEEPTPSDIANALHIGVEDVVQVEEGFQSKGQYDEVLFRLSEIDNRLTTLTTRLEKIGEYVETAILQATMTTADQLPTQSTIHKRLTSRPDRDRDRNESIWQERISQAGKPYEYVEAQSQPELWKQIDDIMEHTHKRGAAIDGYWYWLGTQEPIHIMRRKSQPSTRRR